MHAPNHRNNCPPTAANHNLTTKAKRPVFKSFNTGIPDFESLIMVEGYGICQLRHFYEDGDVLLYMGQNRHFRISGRNQWRYANRYKA